MWEKMLKVQIEEAEKRCWKLVEEVVNESNKTQQTAMAAFRSQHFGPHEKSARKLRGKSNYVDNLAGDLNPREESWLSWQPWKLKVAKLFQD